QPHTHTSTCTCAGYICMMCMYECDRALTYTHVSKICFLYTTNTTHTQTQHRLCKYVCMNVCGWVCVCMCITSSTSDVFQLPNRESKSGQIPIAQTLYLSKQAEVCVCVCVCVCLSLSLSLSLCVCVCDTEPVSDQMSVTQIDRDTSRVFLCSLV